MKLSWVYLFICIALLSCKSQNKSSQEKTKIISLFNGENLDKWRGDSRIWSVKDGCILGQTTDENQIERNTFLIYEDSFSDFELTFQYKIIGGNSGVQYRSKVIDETLFVVGGYQADMEAGINHSGILYEEKGRGIIAKRGEQVVIDEEGSKSVDQYAKSTSIQEHIKSNQWNDYRVLAQGNHLQHYINGYKSIDVVDAEIGKNSDAGLFALQVHAGPNMQVFYKDIKIKRISDVVR
jgi:hypothetical protein